MKTEQMYLLVIGYKQVLEREVGIGKRLDTSRTFASCSPTELLQHALYLAEHFGEYDPIAQYGKLNRHLTAIQMCLSFAGVYTLKELLEHNRS